MVKTDSLAAVLAAVNTLDSKIGLIGQKIRTMEKNEEVIARTLVALNERIKKLEVQAAISGGKGGASQEEFDKKYATKQELKELKYVVDLINPLDYATISQVRELVKEAVKDANRGQPSQQSQGSREQNMLSGYKQDDKEGKEGTAPANSIFKRG